MKIFIVLTIVAASYCLEVTKVTGTTPEVVPCPNSLCHGLADGNYEYKYYGVYRSNYFVQCSNQLASCQPCFPLSLEFSQSCNQCLNKKTDDCVTTLPFQPATTFACPDKCPHAGKHFTGNLADPNNPHQYVGCYQGQTVGCIACPKGLLYNQDWDACLYEGKFKTEHPATKKH
uniref:Chitin-binding type-2 domain-containing protein n=1 Tax=Clytia hemisphaerica TaxID=252671 RepID=A0A7M5UWF6_9CNID